MAPAHKHDWAEIGRVFPLTEDDFDVERLSPDGGHVFEKQGDEQVSVLHPASHKALRDKVPEPTPHIILQCQDPDCPDGPKHIEHVELSKTEWAKIQKAHDGGMLDPEGNGTNRLLSQLSLKDLGLGRIQEMLGEGRTSGASEAVIV